MRPTIVRSICIASLALPTALPAAAHDFWIEPATFRPAPGETVAVSLRVGDGPPGDALPREERRIVRFELLGPDGAAQVAGAEGRAPAGVVRPGGPGAYAVVYRSTDSAVELAAGAFESYLAQEGLERIVGLRAERGESGEPGREQFSRSVKALLVAGPGSPSRPWAPASSSARFHAVHLRPTALPLELVPAASPYDPEAPLERLPFTLLFENEPLAGALVEAFRREAPSAVQRARTDRRGRAVFDVAAGGSWLVTAVHMEPEPPGSGADWRSVWTSLAFEVAGRADPVAEGAGP